MGTLQLALTAEGAAYKEAVLEDGTWGGFIEAEAIARSLHITSGIYIKDANDATKIKKVADIGTGPRQPLSLFLSGNHYRVIEMSSDQLRVDWADGLVVHNPTGDGNCMYEALAYIHYAVGHPKTAEAPAVYEQLSARLARPDIRTAKIHAMRQRAYDNLDDTSANLAGADIDPALREKAADLPSETQVLLLHLFYDKFPPARYEISYDKKQPKIRDRGEQNKVVLLKFIKEQLALPEKEAQSLVGRLILDPNYVTGSSAKDSDLVARIKADRIERGKRLLDRYWAHLSLGGFKSDKVSPTGFHWIGRADEALHEQTGDRGPANDFGIYHCAVRNKVTHAGKAGGSSFFPDAWTRKDFEDAFAKLNSNWEVGEDLASGRKAKGMRLTKKGDDGTIFPQE